LNTKVLAIDLESSNTRLNQSDQGTGVWKALNTVRETRDKVIMLTLTDVCIYNLFITKIASAKKMDGLKTTQNLNYSVFEY